MAGVNSHEIHEAIKKLGDQFRYLNSPQLKNALSALEVSSGEWRCIDRLTSSSDLHALQGYDLSELYEQVLAIAKFVYYARKTIVSNISHLVPADATITDKIVINNFPGNLSIVSEQLGKLYGKLLALDAEENAEPIYHTIPELDRILFYLNRAE